MISSGVRIGTPALATRGLQVDDFRRLGQIIAATLGSSFEAREAELRRDVSEIADRYPLYAGLGSPVTA
jgi:glycine hydroxymethyltransferase